jgi:glycosyltransferase involved in cell wall biosynthesis
MHRRRLWDALSAAREDFSLRIRRTLRNVYINVYIDTMGEALWLCIRSLRSKILLLAFESKPMSESFYLCVGELVAYKRIDLAIAAFKQMKKTLVIGDAEEYHSLKKQAGSTIQFLGRQDFNVLRKYVANCRAFVYPGEEDFGIVMVEALASGRPVITFGQGALEIVIPGKTGIFFEEQTAQSLVNAVRDFERSERAFQGPVLIEHARQHSRKNFESRMRAAIDRAFEGFLPFRSPAAIAASALASPAHVGRSNSQELLQ